MLLTYIFHKILLLHGAITVQNLKVISYSQIELWFFKVTNLDVCGNLVLSNPVTNKLYLLTYTLLYSSPRVVLTDQYQQRVMYVSVQIVWCNQRPCVFK